MRWLPGVSLLTITACACAPPPQVMAPAAVREPAATPPSRRPSNQEFNDRYQRKIAEEIGSRKKELAGQVFKNVQIEWLKDVPAGTFLEIMNVGYSRALGVRYRT
jgi:hypothetical protein